MGIGVSGRVKLVLDFYLREPGKVWVYGVIPSFGVVALWCILVAQCSIFTPDQIGYRLFKNNRFDEAAPRFADSMWKAAAYFKAGDFKEAASVYGGFDTAEAAFNHGNSLVMLGRYEEAIGRYDRALVLNPGWPEAANNKGIAVARAEMIKREGGDMTGGKMGADEIVFDKGKSSSSNDDEVVAENERMSDAEMRAVWLKNVQTRPADFLRSKFAYQQAMSAQTGNSEKPAQ